MFSSQNFPKLKNLGIIMPKFNLNQNIKTQIILNLEVPPNSFKI